MQFGHFVVAAFELIIFVFQKESYTADDLLSTSHQGVICHKQIRVFMCIWIHIIVSACQIYV